MEIQEYNSNKLNNEHSVNIKKNVKINLNFFDLLNKSDINIKNNIINDIEKYKK